MISVVIPVYNVSVYLDECINSVVNQTYREIEIILVDDGSTDDSGKKCDCYAKQDSRIRVVHKTNGGLSSARNAGIEIAQGENIVFIDSDDVVSEDMIEFFHSEIKKDDSIGMVTCLLENFYENGSKNSILRKYQKGIYSSKDYAKLILLQKVDNAACAKMYKRSIIGDIRFTEGIVNEDIIFNLQLTLKPFNVLYTEQPFYKYRIRSGSITTKISPRRFEFVTNAILIKEMFTSVYGDNMDSICNGYILKQVADYIGLLAKYNVRKEYDDQTLFCKHLVQNNSFWGMLNPYWKSIDKLKYLIALYSPTLYHLFLNKIRKPV